MSSTTTIELQLRLDCNGRTTHSDNHSTSSVDPYTTDNDKKKNEEKVNDGFIDYSSKSVTTAMYPNDKDDNSTQGQDDENNDATPTKVATTTETTKGIRMEILDDLLFDCELSDCGLLPRTFWMPADGTKPRFALEQMALEIFHHHVPSSFTYDTSTSGAEWWVQIRPSPAKTGRYSMLSPPSTRKGKHDENKEDKDDDDDDMATSGISFHWDKDEDLRLMMGGSMYIHPHLSTVTYLTGLGAPTMVVTCRVNNFTGEWMVPTANEKAKEKIEDGEKTSSPTEKEEEGVEGYISWPKQGKHLSFDGRFLHAAPPDFMEKGCFERQCQIPDMNNKNNNGSEKNSEKKQQQQQPKELKLLQRRHRRVTFLVNVWLNYKPFNVELFPETMIDKMSPIHSNLECYLFRNANAVNAGEKNKQDGGDNVISNQRRHSAIPFKSQTISLKKRIDTNSSAHENKEQKNENCTQFTWPLGGCDSNEKIHMHIPLSRVQNEMASGGNVKLSWSKFQKYQSNSKDESNASSPECGVYLEKGMESAEMAAKTEATLQEAERTITLEAVEKDEDVSTNKRKREAD